jgi:pilus assembly protein CpaF
VIQVGRLSDGKRKLMSLSELTGMEGETISMQEIWRFKLTGRDENGTVLGYFEATGIRPKFCVQLETHGINLPADLFRPGARMGQ